MKKFVYPKPRRRFCDWEFVPGGTIGQMVRLSLQTGITPDMPSAEIGNDAEDASFDGNGRPFVDPMGDIRTDWFDQAERGFVDLNSRASSAMYESDMSKENSGPGAKETPTSPPLMEPPSNPSSES